MKREILNPNRTDRPIEISRAEVASFAKTGCSGCHGAGSVAFNAPAPPDELRRKVAQGPVEPAPKRYRLCRCVGKQFLGRLDIREIAGRMCWLPAAPQGAKATA